MSDQTHAELERGFELHKAGRIDEAAAVYQGIIAADPASADALHLLGSIKAQKGEAAEGCRLIEAALKLKPDVALMWFNHGNALSVLERHTAAAASFERATALQPDMVMAHYSLCRSLIKADRAADALAAMEGALGKASAPAAGGQHLLTTGKGNALLALQRLDAALAAFDEAVAAAPGNVDAICGRGLTLFELARPAEALAAFDQVLKLVPGHLDALIGRAQSLVALGRATEGLLIINRVIELVPKNAVAHYVRGHARLALFNTAQAAESFRTAAELAPGMMVAECNHADALRELGRYAEAMPVYERVLSLAPRHPQAMSGLAYAALHCFDFETVERLREPIVDLVDGGVRGISPFTFLMLSSSPEKHLACSQTFVKHSCPPVVRDVDRVVPRSRSRLKIAYLSSDFRVHATAYLMAELFELHDRSRFEVIGLSGAPGDASAIRKRLVASFDQFHDVAQSGNAEIDALIRKLEVDIVVDLKGHTAQSRIGALASRPAPVQATYLGYPGTTGAPFIDYVIADDVVAPLSHEAYYSEKLVHLPGCYQVNDRKREIASSTMRRRDHGLPEDAFVFCCFNSAYKISPVFFDCWMRMLARVEGSVLWLFKSNDAAAGNLKRRAAAAGIDPSRIVFAEPIDLPLHLARHRMADLALDTLPYNAHTTGSDALWAGLPMVTCEGETFAGRVGSSLLRAVGLEDLVARDFAAYEALAIDLAEDRKKLAGVRERLRASISSVPLFDTDLFRRNIEAAYLAMHEIALSGQPPRHINIGTDGSSKA